MILISKNDKCTTFGVHLLPLIGRELILFTDCLLIFISNFSVNIETEVEFADASVVGTISELGKGTGDVCG